MQPSLQTRPLKPTECGNRAYRRIQMSETIRLTCNIDAPVITIQANIGIGSIFDRHDLEIISGVDKIEWTRYGCKITIGDCFPITNDLIKFILGHRCLDLEYDDIVREYC